MHRAFYLKILLYFSLALIHEGLFAFGPEDTLGVGPRAQGMAGTAVAVSTDHSAVYYNPADLSYCQRHLVTISDMQVTPNFSLGEGGPKPYQISSSNIMSLGACLALPHNFNLGFYAALPTKSMATMKLQTATFAPRMNLYTADLLSPSVFAGLSYRILKELSVGVSATTTINANVKQIARVSLPNNRMGIELDNEINSSVALIFGIAAEPIENWRLGLSYRTARRGRFEVLAAQQIEVLGDASADAEFAMDGVIGFSPHQVAFGTSYTFFNPKSPLVIATNLTWSHWSTYKGPFIRVVPLETSTNTARGILAPNQPLDYNDNVSVSVGAEYTWNSLVAGRVGYAFKPRTLALPTKSTNVLDGNFHSVAAGATYHVINSKEWLLDVHLNGTIDILPSQTVNKEEGPIDEVGPPEFQTYRFGGLAWNVAAAVSIGF
jgi:long-subunit fatty acid transport protein